MIPIVVDPQRVPIALVGRGAQAASRLAWLRQGGASDLTVFSDDPSPKLAERSGDLLRRRLPGGEDLGRFRLVWIADLPHGAASALAAEGRAAGALVNVEDDIPWCDFHTPSVVRRGDLLLTVSTGGRSPGLAARVRRHLERTFGPEWAGRLDQIAARRAVWRRRELPLPELARRTEAVIERRGWLP
jgi:precorrin-2 dehydrogenase